jgi:hypothetical protein
MGENLCDEIDQVVDLYGDHIRISALTLHRESRRGAAANPSNSRTDFHDRLGRHFDRKMPCMSTATVALDK